MLSVGLDRRNLQNRLIPGNIAFHSSAMDPIREDALAALSFLDDCGFDAEVPFVSSVTGENTRRLDNAYWWSNIRQPVRFVAAMETIMRDHRPEVLLEIAPHSSLQPVIAQCLEGGDPVPACIPTLMRDTDVRLGFHQALGALFRAGVELDFAAQYPRPEPVAHRLPGYPGEDQATIDLKCDDEMFLRQGGYSQGPLIGRKVPSDHLLFEARLSGEDFPWLTEHLVHYAAIMPAAGYIELILQAFAGAPIHMEVLEFAGGRQPDRTILKQCIDDLSSSGGPSEFWMVSDSEESSRAYYEAFHRRQAALQFETLDPSLQADLRKGLLRPGAAEIIFLHWDDGPFEPERWRFLRRVAVAGGLALVCHDEGDRIEPGEGWMMVRAGRRATLLQAGLSRSVSSGKGELSGPRWVLGEPDSLAADWASLLDGPGVRLVPPEILRDGDYETLEEWPQVTDLQAIDFFCGTDPDDPTGERESVQLIALVRALVSHRLEHGHQPCRLTVVTHRAAFQVEEPRGSALWGAARSMALEVGIEACGIVRRVGSKVGHFRAGDAVVFTQGGCVANRVVVNQHLVFGKPDRLSKVTRQQIAINEFKKFVTAELEEVREACSHRAKAVEAVGERKQALLARVHARYQSIPADFRYQGDGVEQALASFRSAVNEQVG